MKIRINLIINNENELMKTLKDLQKYLINYSYYDDYNILSIVCNSANINGNNLVVEDDDYIFIKFKYINSFSVDSKDLY